MPRPPLMQLAAWAVTGVLLLLLGMRLLGHGGEAPAVAVAGTPPEPASTAPAEPAGAGGPAHGGAGLYVHVAGAVAQPGLYRVAAGSRVAAAVDAAGGTTRRADVAGVNLAAPLQDGQQVLVPARGGSAPAASAGGGPSGAAASAPGAMLSLSSATAEQLDGLDGIGPTLAGRILEYRDAHGGFRSVDELREVDGIGEKRFESLREAVQP